MLPSSSPPSSWGPASPPSTPTASTIANGNEGLALGAGQLSVGAVVNGSLSGVVDSSIQGTYPQATWSDTTGSGAGWQGSIAVTSSVYTGAWTPQGSAPALASTNAGGYTGTTDGLQITVSVGSGGSSTSTPFTWVDNSGGSGSGTATNGTPAAVEYGVTIDFASGTTYTSGAQYIVDAGVQNSSALELLSSAASVGPASGTVSPSPTLVNSTATVSAGGASVYGTSVPFVSAAIDTGMGSYTIAPGVDVIVDSSSWAATYTAQAQYTIASGPGSAPTTASSSGTTVTAAYSQAVLADSPSAYWPLNETSGTTANDASGNGNTGTYSAGVSVGAIASPSGSSVAPSFNGSNGYVATTTEYTNPEGFSIAMWFKTTAVGGLIMFSSVQDPSTAAAGSYDCDRMMWVDNSGNLMWGVYDSGNASVVALQSTSLVNTGTWQFAVVSVGPAGMQMYVNGQLQASNSTTTAQDYSGWWTLGYASTRYTWPDQPSDLFLTGAESGAAIIPSQLSAAQVSSLYNTGGI